MFLPHPRVKVSIVGSLRDREVACSASDRQGSNFESGVWRTVSSQSSHHPQEVLLAQFSLYVHKGDLKPDSFHFYLIKIMISDPLMSATQTQHQWVKVSICWDLSYVYFILIMYISSGASIFAPTNSPHIYANSPQPTRSTFIPTRPTYMATRPNQFAPHYTNSPHI